MHLSVVIPFVHEYPALCHTLFAFQSELADVDFKWEIIVVENRERDPYTNKFLQWFRVPINLGRIRYAFEEVPCGPAARVAGAKIAKGKYVIFTDAHVQPCKNTVPMLLDLLEENDHIGIAHGSTVKSHYDTHRAGTYYQLFGGGINLLSHWHGAYRASGPVREPFPIGGAPLAYMAVRKQQFLDLHGYHPACRGYPHPEGYVPLKYWMFGQECWAVPLAIHFHSLFPRKYGTPPKVDIMMKGKPYRLVGNDNLIRNAMMCGYTLGGEQWADATWNAWYERGGNKNILNGIKESVLESAKEERQWIRDNATMELNDVLKMLNKRKVRGVNVLPEWIK